MWFYVLNVMVFYARNDNSKISRNCGVFNIIMRGSECHSCFEWPGVPGGWRMAAGCLVLTQSHLSSSISTRATEPPTFMNESESGDRAAPSHPSRQGPWRTEGWGWGWGTSSSREADSIRYWTRPILWMERVDGWEDAAEPGPDSDVWWPLRHSSRDTPRANTTYQVRHHLVSSVILINICLRNLHINKLIDTHYTQMNRISAIKNLKV